MALYRDPYMRLRALAAGEDPDAAPTRAPDPVLSEEDIRREQLIAQNERMSESGRALRQGVQNVRGSGVAARGLVRQLAGDETGALADFQDSQRIQSEAAEFGPRVQSVEDVEGVGSGLEYVRNVGLTQLPNVALSAAGGLAGAGARLGVRGLAQRAAGEAVERTAMRGAAGEIIQPAARRAAATAAGAAQQGAAVGGAAAGTLLQSGIAPGIVLDEEGTGTQSERAQKAAVGAVATGALEALPVVALLRRFGLGGAERALTGDVLSRVAAQAGRQGTAEAATEVAQTVGERLTHKWVNDNVELVGPEAYADYINAAAGGFVGGGIFGAPAGLRGAGRDSEAGRKFQQTLRDWRGRTTPAAPSPGRPAPGQPMGAPDPLTAAGVRQQVDQMAETVATTAPAVADKIKTEAGKLVDTAGKLMTDLLGEQATENSIYEILDAEPFEGQTDASGVTTFNSGAGISPAMDLVRAPRAAELARQMGVPMRDAIAMSMIDDPVTASNLRKSGAVSEAAKAIAGADPGALDNAKLTAFQDALGPEGDGRRNAFNRAAATAWEVNREDGQVALPPERVPTRSEPTAAQQARGIVDEERPLRTAASRSNLSKPISRGTPQNTLIFRDAKGVRRGLSGKQLGRLIIDAREADPDLAAMPTEVQVAEVISDYTQQGFQIEPDSVRALELGRNWGLPPGLAATLRNGLAPTRQTPERLTLRGQSTQAPSQRTRTSAEERELNAEYGRGGQVDTQRNEVEDMVTDQRLGPRRGAPQPLRATGGRVTGEGAVGDRRPQRERTQRRLPAAPETAPQTTPVRVQEGQTVDAPIDADMARTERARFPTEASDFNDLDRIVERMTGGALTGDFEERRTRVGVLLRDGRPNTNPAANDRRQFIPLTRAERAELMDAAARYGEAQYQRALKKWQKNRTRKNYREMLAARDRAERGANVPSTPEVRSAELTREVAARDAERAERAARRGEATEGSIDFAATRTPEGIRAAIRVPTRSKASLFALKNAIVNSTHSETVKNKLLVEVNEAVAQLVEQTNAAARNEFSGNTIRLSKTAGHFNDARKRIADKRTVGAALRALRDIATPAQKRLIDTLVGMRAVDTVTLAPQDDTKVMPGLAGGRFNYNPSAPLTGRVFLSIDPREAAGQSQDLVQLLLHEAIHAATTFAEINDAETRTAVEQLLEHTRTYAKGLGVDPDMFYGLSNTQEFLAEAFTSAPLQDLMRQMPARNTRRFANLWDEFKDFVAKLLGFTSEDATALDEIFALGLDLARTTANAREAQFDAVFGENATEFSPTGYAIPGNGAQPRNYVSALNPDSRRYLDALFRRGDVYRQIKAAVPAHRQDELLSADRGPQLMINTGLALAFTGKLKTEGNAVQQLWDTISKVAQIPTKAAYGRALLTDLGKKPTVRRLRETSAQDVTLAKPMADITKYVNARVKPVVKAFGQDMNSRLRTTGVPALTQLATLVSQRTGEFRADASASFTARHVAERGKRLNQFFKITQNWDTAKKTRVLQALQSEAATTDPDVERVRGFFREMRDYLVAAGVDEMGKIENYFPVSIDRARVVKNKAAFVALFSAPNIVDAARMQDLKLLQDAKKKAAANGASPQQLRGYDKRIAETRKLTPAEVAEKWYHFAASEQRSSQVGDVTFTDGEHDPTFKPQNKRLMAFVYQNATEAQKATFATFQDQNMERVVAQYVGRATRKAEWSRLNLGERIATLLKQAKAQGATDQQLQLGRDYVDQIMGSYASDWHPFIKNFTERLGVKLPPFEKFQNLQTALITYQNLRLLPLALMSSLIDPLGVMVRSGGNVRESFGAYRQAVRALRDKDGTDALRALAEDLGIIERHAVSEALIYMYGLSQDVTGMSARINATLFKYNGLEYVTKFSRLAALSAGQRFLLQHKNNPGKQSARYLQELGLKPADIALDPQTGLLVRSAKIEQALARFVDEAVVRPTPAQRPSWHNDPHFQLAAQYKGYLYSFWNTIVRRGGVELSNGNPAVLLPLLMYVPIQAVGEMMRDMAQGDDDDREWQDYAWLGVDRSGLLGPHVDLARNARQDISYGSSALNSLAGPTGQQLSQAYDTFMGQRNPSRTAVEALPASALFEDWFQ